VPELRSPLTLIPRTGDLPPLTLTDLSALAKVQVKAPPGGQIRNALGTPFGRVKRYTSSGSPVDAVHGALVIGSGPGEWLVLGPPDMAAEVRAALTTLVAGVDEFASVVDLTHGRALVRLRGADSAALLAKVCAVDLADAVTPDGAAFRSSVARVVTDVVRDDLPDGTRSYLLHCERSSGQYLAESLLDAGAEFDIAVTPIDPRDERRTRGPEV
jgi:heterotetrameric sarcosine oxidase gamma subunit